MQDFFLNLFRFRIWHFPATLPKIHNSLCSEQKMGLHLHYQWTKLPSIDWYWPWLRINYGILQTGVIRGDYLLSIALQIEDKSLTISSGINHGGNASGCLGDMSRIDELGYLGDKAQSYRKLWIYGMSQVKDYLILNRVKSNSNMELLDHYYFLLVHCSITTV